MPFNRFSIYAHKFPHFDNPFMHIQINSSRQYLHFSDGHQIFASALCFVFVRSNKQRCSRNLNRQIKCCLYLDCALLNHANSTYFMLHYLCMAAERKKNHSSHSMKQAAASQFGIACKSQMRTFDSDLDPVLRILSFFLPSINSALASKFFDLKVKTVERKKHFSPSNPGYETLKHMVMISYLSSAQLVNIFVSKFIFLINYNPRLMNKTFPEYFH